MPASSQSILPNNGIISQYAIFLRNGGILVYPTETYYALGCLANRPEAIKEIFALKGRPGDKPLPLIAASIYQARLAVDLDMLPLAFLRSFWPGALTIIAPGKKLPMELLSREGKAAIRVSSLPLARRLARLGAFPLVATSANLSGQPAAASHDKLDKKLLERGKGLPMAVLRTETHGAGKASTIVEPARLASGAIALKIRREGLVQSRELAEWLPVFP